MSEIYIPKDSFEAEKKKILTQAKEAAWQGMPKTASALMHDQDPYPSPYLNLSDYQMPRTMVEIFKWCRYFYKFDSLIGGAVNALARFPVTDIIMEDIQALPEGWDPKVDSPTLKIYQQTFKDIKVADELLKIGIDYWLYGNCFVFGEFTDKSFNPEVNDYRWSKIFRLDPSTVSIEIDPLTQEKSYKWQVPPKIRKICRDKKPKDRYDQIPDVIKKAVKENKSVVLKPDNVYHFSREGESGDGSVWGTPLILNVMKQIAYRNLLRQAQEAIAREHIVPFRIYYLEPTTGMDPNASWNNVAKALAGQLEQASKDPNYKVVSPLPVGTINSGGQGRALMLTAEIEQLQAEILAGMGVPREFIFGGVSYSAASISLRILENQFQTYRLLLMDFMNNFLIRRMAEIRGEWRTEIDDDYLVSVKMSDLKMQDDIQQKQLVVNLNATNKISDEFLYDTMGIDADKMKLQLEVEIFERMERERRMQQYQTETQFMLQQQTLQYNMQLQSMMPPQMMGQDPNAPQGQQAQQGQQSQQPSQQQQKSQPKEKTSTGADGKPTETTTTKTVEKTHTKYTSDDEKKDKKPETKKDDKKEKPADSAKTKAAADYDDLMEKMANIGKVSARDATIAAICTKLSKMSPCDQVEMISKLSEDTRFLVNSYMSKYATASTVSAGGSQGMNMALAGMTEMQKTQALPGAMQANAAQGAANFTENAMKPLPVKAPPRRATMK